MGSLLTRLCDTCDDCLFRDKAQEISRVQQDMLLLQNAVREVERNLLVGCC